MYIVLCIKYIIKMLFIISWFNMLYERRRNIKYNFFIGVIGFFFFML